MVTNQRKVGRIDGARAITPPKILSSLEMTTDQMNMYKPDELRTSGPGRTAYNLSSPSTRSHTSRKPLVEQPTAGFCLRLVQLTLQSVPTPYQDHTVLTPPSPRVPLPPPPSASTPPARSPPASTSPASAQYAPPASTPPAYAPFAPHGARRPLPASLLPASLPP